MRPCFTFKAATETKPAIVAIDDEIGFWGVQASDFRKLLDGVKGQDLDVEINSPGGDVMAGLGMYNMLRAAASNGVNVTTRVTGLAGSIASIVLLAGDKREMPKNAFSLVHSIKGYQGYATAEEMRDLADSTEKIGNQVKQIYIDRAGIDEAKATEMMSKDTWLTADESLALGLATVVTDEVKAVAKFDVARAELPAHVAKVFDKKPGVKNDASQVDDAKEGDQPENESTEASDGPVAEQVIALAKGAGFEAHAAAIALSCSTVDAAKTRISALSEISALCNVAKKPEYVAVAVREGKSVADVRAHLVEALASQDKHTDTSKKVDLNGGTTTNSGVNTSALWDSHNSQRKKKER